MDMQCPNCGGKYKVADGSVRPGAKIRCSLCKTVFAVPDKPAGGSVASPERHATKNEVAMSSAPASAKANPAPLGLAGFAMTTILLNIHNAGFYEISVMIMSMGVFYGGIAQIIAGIMEYRQGNTFGTIAFVSYGSFWLTLVFIWTTPKLGLPAADPVSMGWYLALWGLFTFLLFIGTLKGKTIGKLVFGSLTILFFLLAAANFTGNHAIHTVAGFEGIACGAFALYEAAALVINEKFGRTLLPL